MYNCGKTCIWITKYLISADCSISLQSQLQKKTEGANSQGSKEEQQVHADHGSLTHSAPFDHPTLRALTMFPRGGTALENSCLSLVMESSEQFESLLGQLLLSQCSRNCCREEALFISSYSPLLLSQLSKRLVSQLF